MERGVERGKGAAVKSLWGQGSLEGEDADGRGRGCKGKRREVSTQLCARAIQSFRMSWDVSFISPTTVIRGLPSWRY